MPESLSNLTELLLAEAASDRPVYVEFESALLTADLAWEALIGRLQRQRWLLLVSPLLMAGGKTRQLESARKSESLKPEAFPYRYDLVDALKACDQGGRRVVLVGSDTPELHGAGAHLGLQVQPLEVSGNPSRRDRLQELSPSGFDYITGPGGDATALRAAANGYVVGGSRGEGGGSGLEHVRFFAPRLGLPAALIRQLRPHQWSKNALLAVPVLLAAGVPRLDKLAIACLAALTFSLCASAGYVLNDLLDIEADRVHRSKRHRPFASGALPVIAGPPLFWGLLAASFGLSLAFLVPQFTVLLALYLVGTLTYSLYLKKQLLVDVLVLAGLYTHRILAGGVATSIEVTTWLLGFSMFLFTSLAFAKRYVELHATDSDDQVKNRGYFKTDLQMVTAMGTTSGYIAALVFVLYVDSGVVKSSYREPALLWLILPVLLYWLGRIWLLAGRGQMQDDPVKFAMKDKTSLWCGVLMAVIVALARFTPASLANLLSWQS